MSAEVFVQRVVVVNDRDVHLRFFKPELDHPDFVCQFEIDWPEGVFSRKAYGVDEVQALILAMEKVHTELLLAREHKGNQVSWLGQRRLGLPVTDTLKDWDAEDPASASR